MNKDFVCKKCNNFWEVEGYKNKFAIGGWIPDYEEDKICKNCEEEGELVEPLTEKDFKISELENKLEEKKRYIKKLEKENKELREGYKKSVCNSDSVIGDLQKKIKAVLNMSKIEHYELDESFENGYRIALQDCKKKLL